MTKLLAVAAATLLLCGQALAGTTYTDRASFNAAGAGTSFFSDLEGGNEIFSLPFYVGPLNFVGLQGGAAHYVPGDYPDTSAGEVGNVNGSSFIQVRLSNYTDGFINVISGPLTINNDAGFQMIGFDLRSYFDSWGSNNAGETVLYWTDTGESGRQLQAAHHQRRGLPGPGLRCTGDLAELPHPGHPQRPHLVRHRQPADLASVSAAPEPASVALLLAGLGTVGVAARRRRAGRRFRPPPSAAGVPMEHLMIKHLAAAAVACLACAGSRPPPSTATGPASTRGVPAVPISTTWTSRATPHPCFGFGPLSFSGSFGNAFYWASDWHENAPGVNGNVDGTAWVQVRLNTFTGALTLASDEPLRMLGLDLRLYFDASGNSDGGETVLFSTDTGESGSLPPATNSPAFPGLVFDAPVTAISFSIGADHGNGFTWFGIDNLQTYSAVSAVPEPASVALLLAGLGSVGVAARWRRAG
jgi:hypothetical protein